MKAPPSRIESGHFPGRGLPWVANEILREDRNNAIDRPWGGLLASGNIKKGDGPSASWPRRRAKGGGIFLGGDFTGSLTIYCEQIETWPSIGQRGDCYRLGISRGATPSRLVGTRRRAKGGGLFLGGDRHASLTKYCEQIEAWPSIGQGRIASVWKYQEGRWPVG